MTDTEISLPILFRLQRELQTHSKSLQRCKAMQAEEIENRAVEIFVAIKLSVEVNPVDESTLVQWIREGLEGLTEQHGIEVIPADISTSQRDDGPVKRIACT